MCSGFILQENNLHEGGKNLRISNLRIVQNQSI